MSHTPDPDSMRSRVRRYVGWLSRTYPRVFNRRHPEPLALGTFDVLVADLGRPAWADARVIQNALASWTRRDVYRQALVNHVRPRRTLTGERLAPPTAEEVILTRAAWKKAKGQAPGGARGGANVARFPRGTPKGDFLAVLRRTGNPAAALAASGLSPADAQDPLLAAEVEREAKRHGQA